MAEKTVLIFGATGSIGRQTLDVLERLEGFRLVGFTYHRNEKLAREISRNFGVEDFLSTTTGVEGALEMVRRLRPDITVVAVPGFAGLEITLGSIPHTRRIALANKETMVCGGWLVREELEKHGVELLPIDSEHSAVFQILEEDPVKITLTASGGSLRDWPLESLKRASIEDVMRHPVWKMGTKVTVDSATMVNKALEVLEAMELFDLPRDRVDVLVHREGIVHGMVYLRDGTVKILSSIPDMRIPIALSLTYPNRSYEYEEFPDFVKTGLGFERPDPKRYPAFFLVDHVYRSYKLRTAFNASDEVAVELFSKGIIEFTDIPVILERVLDRIANLPEPEDLEDLRRIDSLSREYAEEVIS